MAKRRPNYPEDSGGGVISIGARAEEGPWHVGAHGVEATNARLLVALVNICEGKNPREDMVFFRVAQMPRTDQDLCTRATERVRTCAGVGGARYHVKVVQPIPFDAVAEVRADCIGAVAVRSADSIFFCAFTNVCPRKCNFFKSVFAVGSKRRHTHHFISQQGALKCLRVVKEHLKVPHLTKINV